jgi:photosystem II stability/assembly factor-like uncharacterized protein
VRGRLLLWTGLGLGLGLSVWGGQGIGAQGGQQPAARVDPVDTDLPEPVNKSNDPLLQRFVWRQIGPAVMGGRLDDIAVPENDGSTIYLGFATGGVWKTTNNGTTWTPIFDKYEVPSIGDIEIAPSDPNIIYVGTGEPNNRQSSSFGAGVFKSTDAGKTFTYVGLKETQSIGRMVIHPKDPNTVYVAAVGHLFGPNPERGVYKTTDGGKTWTNVKFIDNDTGFIDIVMHPTDPNTLFAASYQRRRVPWGFNGGGTGSAIWRTNDGGKTWSRLMGNGLPTNPIIGRIGLNFSRSKPNIIYAQIEVGASGGTGAGVNDDGSLQTPGQGRGGGGGGGRGGQQEEPPPDPNKSGIWRSEDGGKTWHFRSNNNNRPMYYSNIRVDPNNPEIVYTTGANAYKSVDGAKTFDNMGGQSHGDHHQIWIDPRNSNHLLIGNDGGFDVSYDQGETWEEISLMAVGQFYAISADMRKPYYVCGGLQDNGSWCGPSAVRNNSGIMNHHWYRVGGGDGFYTANDPRDYTIGYSESQDGNTNRYDLRTGGSRSIRPSAPMSPEQRRRMQELQEQGGGRGGGFGGGRGGNPEGNIVPPPAPGTQFRFYWSTPYILSSHNPDVVYLGGDRLFKSTNRGDTWSASADLTNNIGRNDRPIMGADGKAPMASKHDGAASYSNIITIGESPLTPDVVWVGTNDGNVQVSRDAGATFKNVVGNLQGVPKETHVSRVEPGHFEAGTCYVTFDGHRTDDHKPYVYVTRDFGATWTSISSNLPIGHVNVIREDPRNRNLLYLGTEYAFYISLNGGKEWKPFMTGLPYVRIDDILVHPRDNDLIVGTHGRSIWIIDDITPLQQLSEAVTSTDAYLFHPRAATRWLEDTQAGVGFGAAKHFRGQNPQGGATIGYYLKSAPSGDVKITIANVNGQVVRELEGTKFAGINRVQWNLQPNPPPQGQREGRGGEARGGEGRGGGRGGGGGGRGGRGGRGGGGFVAADNAVAPGTYVVKLSVGGKELMSTVLVEADELR